MRVGIDMHFAQSTLAGVGIGAHSFHHIAYLEQRDDIEVLLFQPKFEGMTRRQYVQELSQFILEDKIDILHLPSPMTVPYPDVIGSNEVPPVRLSATVYDLIPLIYPKVYQPLQQHKEKYEKHIQLLHRVDSLLAISQHTRQDLLRFGFPENKITYIGAAGNEFYFPYPTGHLEDFAGVFPTDKPFVLTFSPLDFRKNVRRTVQAFAMATKDKPGDCQLVVVGDTTSELQQQLTTAAAQYGRAGTVHFAGRVSKAQLLRLYNRATATAMVSLYEGWGMPVLESLQCGTPVLTSNRTSLPEVAGAAAIYVDPTDVNNIADGFHRLLYVPGVRERLSAAATTAASRHQWSDVTERTVQAFQQLMQTTPIAHRVATPAQQRQQMQLAPNRYRVVRRRNQLPVTYVSFNLQEVPADARIVRAVLHFPMQGKARKPLVRGMTRGWSVANVAKARPLTRTLKIGGRGRVTRRGKGLRREAVLHWPCTVLARRWRNRPLRNHGVMIRRATKRPPVLTVTYAKTTTVYQ